MKKAFLVIIFAVISVSLYAENIFSLTKPTYLNVRSAAQGGSHVTDHSDFFTLLRNPAGLGYLKNATLYTGIGVNLSSTSAEALSCAVGLLRENPSDSEKEETAENIDSLLNKGVIIVDASLAGPFCAGFVKNGFGLGFFHSNNSKSLIISETSAGFLTSSEYSIYSGYGFKFNISKNHSLGFGCSVDMFAVMPETVYTGELSRLMNAFYSRNLDDFPVYSMFGASLNGGMIYSYRSVFEIAVVYNNGFAPYFMKRMTYKDYTSNLFNLFMFDFSTTYLFVPELNAGIAFKLPCAWTNGVLYDWKLRVDYNNLLTFFSGEKLSRNAVLNLTIGTEISFFNTIIIRAGMAESYLCAGFGIKLDYLNIDVALYGKEIGNEPGDYHQTNIALSVSFQK